VAKIASLVPRMACLLGTGGETPTRNPIVKNSCCVQRCEKEEKKHVNLCRLRGPSTGARKTWPGVSELGERVAAVRGEREVERGASP